MKALTISRKIALGFGALILISGVLGGVAITSMRSVQGLARTLATEYVPEVDVAGDVQRDLAVSQLAIRSYGFTGDDNYLTQARKGMEVVVKDLADADRLAESHPNLVRLRENLGKVRAAIAAYTQAVEATATENQAIAAGRKTLDSSAADFIANIDKLIESQAERCLQEIKRGDEPAVLTARLRKLMLAQEVRGLGNAARIAAFKAQALRESALFQESVKQFEPMELRFTELFSLVKVQADREELERVKRDAYAYRDAVRGLMQRTATLEEVGQKRVAAAEVVRALVNEMTTTGMKRTIEAADLSDRRLATASFLMWCGVASALGVGAVIAFVIIRGTTKVLNQVTEGLGDSASQVSAAASQVSGASQALAEGSTEQAASLEETSASLEEMSSMTKRNADGAQHARELSSQARSSADLGAAHMQEMRQAMDAIKGSSDDIAKIIKTIDEIAFQTNILALNAAVEAARAGEAGMGFAVVADEVRNLAQRSAQSAKETATKIEDAIRKSEHGVVISAKVAEALTDIVTKAREMETVVTEIATASLEQNQGIEQVNTAVGQMDKVTQSNASSAEESAAAAEELNAQAAAMQQAIEELRRLVSDRVTTRPAATPAPVSTGARPPAKARKSAPPAPKLTRRESTEPELSFASAGEGSDDHLGSQPRLVG